MTIPSASPLEQALLGFEDSLEGRKVVLEKFLAARIYVLLDKPWDGRSLPSTEMRLLFVSDGENQEQAMLAVFTDRSKAESIAAAMGEFQHVVEVDSKWALLGVPATTGVRINPNSEPGFRILPELTTELRKLAQQHLAARQRTGSPAPTGTAP